MAVTYVGSTFMPPIFGVLTNSIGFWLLPFFLMAMIIAMLVASERVNNVVKNCNVI